MQPDDRDAAYLWDMQQAAKEVVDMLDDYDLAAFLHDTIRMRAVERTLEIIGESARRVSESFQAAHSEIPWREIIGQRNILAHEYGQIDHELLYNTAVKDIPALIDQIEMLLPPLDQDSAE